MGMKDWYMDRTIKKMDADEKKGMMNTMMDKFFESMTAEEKKELMNSMMPKMMDKMFEGMSGQDKMELMSTMMPRMMGQMFGGGEGTGRAMMPMPACGSAPEILGATGAASADFKPWLVCPCREFCEYGKKAKEAARGAQ